MDVYGLMHVNKEKAWEETLMSLDLNMLLLMQKKKTKSKVFQIYLVGKMYKQHHCALIES